MTTELRMYQGYRNEREELINLLQFLSFNRGSLNSFKGIILCIPLAAFPFAGSEAIEDINTQTRTRITNPTESHET